MNLITSTCYEKPPELCNKQLCAKWNYAISSHVPKWFPLHAFRLVLGRCTESIELLGFSGKI